MQPIMDGMRKILAQTRINEHPDDYSIVYIDPVDERNTRELLRDLRPFSSITYTQDEISVVLRSSDWAGLRGSFPRHKEEESYRLITFDLVLDLSIVGFLSVVSTALAEEGVPLATVVRLRAQRFGKPLLAGCGRGSQFRHSEEPQATKNRVCC